MIDGHVLAGDPESLQSPPFDPVRPALRTPSRLRLLYIGGAHKSGATALGAVLGSVPAVFFAGEAYRFPHPIFDESPPTRRCSCGARVGDCPFWTTVRRWASADPVYLAKLREGQLRFERWRHLPRTLWKAFRNDPELIAHVDRMTQFLQWVADASGSEVVVESSYNPLRGWLYGRSDPDRLEVRYLHLVRDGRTFISAERSARDPPEVRWRWVRSLPVIVGRWVASHLLAIALLDRRGRYLRVRYEDLLHVPQVGLPALGRFAGLDLRETLARVVGHSPILMRHIAAGNSLRLKGRIVLDPAFARRPRLGVGALVTFWLFGGWLALLLGYGPGRGPTAARPR